MDRSKHLPKQHNRFQPGRPTVSVFGDHIGYSHSPINRFTPQVVRVIVQQQKSTINVYQWIIGLHSEYKITKRLSVFGNFFYLNQSSSQNGGQGLNLSSLNYDSTRIDLGFHYEFDPIHL